MHLRSPVLGTLGLVALAAVAVQLLRGGLSITEGALRIGIVAVGLLAVEKVALPLARSLVGPPREVRTGEPELPVPGDAPA